MRRLPPLNALRAFEAAAQHLSFTKAAGELNVTQAAISHQIRALEDWLGMPLFRRQNRALLLTDAGQAYLPAMRDAFDLMHQATAKLRQRDRSGALNVSTFTSFAAKWLMPRLGRFTSAHPEIEIRLGINDTLLDFGSDEVDVGVRYGRGDWRNLHIELLMTEEVFVVCSPKLLEGEHPLREPADLRHHTLLHDDLPEDWSTWLDAAGVDDAVKVRARGDLVFNHSEMVLQGAAEGLGVALGRSALVADDLAAGRLVKPFNLQLPTQSAYYVVHSENAGDRPKIKAFTDWLHEEAARDHRAPAGETAPPV